MTDEPTVGSVFNWAEPVSDFATDIGAGSGGGSSNPLTVTGPETAALDVNVPEGGSAGIHAATDYAVIYAQGVPEQGPVFSLKDGAGSTKFRVFPSGETVIGDWDDNTDPAIIDMYGDTGKIIDLYGYNGVISLHLSSDQAYIRAHPVDGQTAPLLTLTDDLGNPVVTVTPVITEVVTPTGPAVVSFTVSDPFHLIVHNVEQTLYDNSELNVSGSITAEDLQTMLDADFVNFPVTVSGANPDFTLTFTNPGTFVVTGSGITPSSQTVSSDETTTFTRSTQVTPWASPFTVTQVENPNGGEGNIDVVTFASGSAAFAIAVAGDEFPRVVFNADATDGIYFGDGTINPVDFGANIYGTNDSFTIVGGGSGSDKVIKLFGDVSLESLGTGPIIKSPNGTRFRIKVGNDGVLSTEEVA